MDVSSPISTAIPSLDGPVLSVLATTTEPMTVTDVWDRAARGSRGGVHRVIQRLVTTGLVADVPGGFVLNRDHVAAGPVIALTGLHGELARRIRQWLNDDDVSVVAAGLFGSAARRDGDVSSDIDVLVVLDDEPERCDEVRDDLARAVERWTGNQAHVVVLTPEQLSRLRSEQRPIVASWREDLQMLTGELRTVFG